MAERTAQNKRLIENAVSLTDLELILKNDSMSARALERDKEKTTKIHRDAVEHWLAAVDLEAEHRIHQQKRGVCKDPGRWLLRTPEFTTWAGLHDSLNPMLWLSGIPGAGKTVLASIVVDKLREIKGATVAHFYCKHGDEKRNSADSVTRSILAQVLDQNPDLLSYYYDKAHMNVSLASPAVLEQMLGTSLRSCGRVYIVLDGLDECDRAARKRIVRQFKDAVNTATEVGSVRCLFVSQEDGVAAEGFHGLPSIKVDRQNLDDISDFAGVWQQTIIKKFGTNGRNLGIQDIISKRAKGMFIFAELFAQYLAARLDILDLEEQLRPDNLPVELDSLYERILNRVREVRDIDTMGRIEVMLGWIVSAIRPLRWEEIQSAVCINPDSRSFDTRRRLVDSPRELFASLVEWHPDDTVDLVHGTARQYLLKRKSDQSPDHEPVVKIHEAHFSLAMRCLTYLALSQFDLDRSEDDIKADLLDGFYQLYDYASACWVMHLQAGMSGRGKDELIRLCAALKRFIKMHWSPSHKRIQHVKKVQNALQLLEQSDELQGKQAKNYDRLIQAVAWAKMQSGQDGIGPTEGEALTLWKMTARIRSVLETMDRNGAELERVESMYGVKRFKRPWVNCYSYHHGFRVAKRRDRHVDRHTRPYLCVVAGCPMEVFGYALDKQLQKHLFDAHHILEAGDGDKPVFPEPRKERTNRTKDGEAAKFKCPNCSKGFPRNKSLLRHQKTHSSAKRYACTVCSRTFTRKEDCKRHQDTHGGRKYVCAGVLKDGTKWGCNKTFTRKDKLREHFWPRREVCILPLLREKQEAGDGGKSYLDENIFTDQTGANAEVLLAAVKSLPPFCKFLEKCGLSPPSSGGGGSRTAASARSEA